MVNAERVFVNELVVLRSPGVTVRFVHLVRFESFLTGKRPDERKMNMSFGEYWGGAS
jgi:hypothetical protein